MRKVIGFALALCVLSAGLAGGVGALEIAKVTDQVVHGFRYAAPAQARSYLAGYTVLVKLGQVEKRVLNVIPISSVAVLYFAPDGAVLGWSGKSDVVERGVWKVQSKPNGNDLCLFFDKGLGAGFCTVLWIGHPMFMESTKGNPFHLKARAAVPYDLGRFGISLGGIAKKLGL